MQPLMHKLSCCLVYPHQHYVQQEVVPHQDDHLIYIVKNHNQQRNQRQIQQYNLHFCKVRKYLKYVKNVIKNAHSPFAASHSGELPFLFLTSTNAPSLRSNSTNL